MLSNRLAFGALAVACIGAAAGGGYLATRQAVPASAAGRAGDMAVPSEFGATAETAAGASAVIARATESAVTQPLPAAPQVEQPRRRPAPTPANRTTRRATAPTEAPPASAQSLAPIPATSLPPVSTELPAAPPVFDASTAGLDSRADQDAARDTIERENVEELVIASDSVIGLQLEGGVNSERARVEDAVDARVIRDVRVGRRVAIPAGSRALGSVMLVERGGRLKDRARLGIRFHTLVLADGARVPISTGTIYRYGDAPSDRSAKKIGGGAVAGAILGAIVGGARGAAVGATAGAGGGTAMVMAGERSAAEFPSGTEVTARILDSVTVVVTER